MKKIIVLLILVVALVGCTTKKKEKKLINPITTYNKVEELDAAVGYKTNVPDKIFNYQLSGISTITTEEGVIAQAIYTDGNEICIRMSKDLENFHGDYTTYDTVEKANFLGLKATTYGNKDTISLATWKKGDLNMSLTSQTPLTTIEVSIIIASLK